MGKAQIVHSQDKQVKTVSPVLERKAGVKVISEDNTPKMEKSAELDNSETPKETFITESKATIVYKATAIEPESDETQETVKGSEGTVDTVVKSDEPNKEDLPDKFKGKSLSDVVKAYKELESLTTRLAQKNMELESSSTKAKEEENSDVELPDDIGEILLDNPKKANEIIKKAVKSVTERQVKAVRDKEESIKSEDDIKGAKKYVLENYPEYFSSTHSPTVDALAVSYPTGTYLERYKRACEDYSKLRIDARVEVKKEVQKELKEVEEMKDSAIVPASSPKKVEKKKFLKRSELNYLITKNPLLYIKRRDEIISALRENRVVEDA